MPADLPPPKAWFSPVAADYRRFRPRYPAALFPELAALAPGRGAAWDCATGNGQAAIELARFFEHVIATDASSSQVANAERHERVEYRVERSERTTLSEKSIDLTVVAQALHWFELGAFWEEVRRVSRPRAVVAAWCYALHRVAPEIDRVIDHFYEDVIGPWWPPERRHIENEYRDLEFPFTRIALAPPPMTASWSLAELLGYMASWSAVTRYREAKGSDPMPLIAREFEPLWGAPASRREVRWALTLIAGRVE